MWIYWSRFDRISKDRRDSYWRLAQEISEKVYDMLRNDIGLLYEYKDYKYTLIENGYYVIEREEL